MIADPFEDMVPVSLTREHGGDLARERTVASLVGNFCMRLEAALMAKEKGTLSPEQFVAGMKALARAHAGIFYGHHPLYWKDEGYPGEQLHAKLKADLGDFWTRRHAAWADDPVCVLFEWLGVIAAEKIRLAQGDDMLLGVMLRPSVQYAVQVLLGGGRKQT